MTKPSVAVKLVVERERDIQKFDSKPYFKIDAEFEVKNAQGRLVKMKAESPERFDTEGGARTFLEKCRSAAYQIRKIDVKPTKRKPTAPFTTSTLQQEESRKLGFSVNRTMSNAQRLYEAGHISYMRTDSTNLSETALAAIAAEIETKFGKQYVQTRRFKTGKDSAQEAHEAIRPTYIEKQNVAQDRDEHHRSCAGFVVVYACRTGRFLVDRRRRWLRAHHRRRARGEHRCDRGSAASQRRSRRRLPS